MILILNGVIKIMSGRLVIRDLVCGCRRKVLSGVLVIVKGSGWDWFCGMNGECDLAKGSPR